MAPGQVARAHTHTHTTRENPCVMHTAAATSTFRQVRSAEPPDDPSISEPSAAACHLINSPPAPKLTDRPNHLQTTSNASGEGRRTKCVVLTEVTASRLQRICRPKSGSRGAIGRRWHNLKLNSRIGPRCRPPSDPPT